jgi:hypothetical protein
VRACVVLACFWVTLLTATLASAAVRAQTKTRVWAFESAPALNIRLHAAASHESRLAFPAAQTEPALGSPHAARGAGTAAEKLTVTFGRDANQIQHAFRHIDKLGLSRTAVQEAVQKHLPSVVDKIPAGRPLNQVIEVGGQRIQYSAFRLPDGSINVGRIHGVP